MKVCLLMSNPFPPEEGIGTYVYNLSKVLVDMGHDVTVITRGGISEKTFNMDDIDIVKTKYIPLFPFHINVHSIFINKYFSTNDDFDIIHLHSPLPPYPTIKKPVVSTIHTSLLEDIRAFETFNLKNACTVLATHFVSVPNLHNVVKKSAAVTVVSPSVKAELEKYYGARGVLCIGNGVNERIFNNINGGRNENFILYVGRLGYRKGLFDLVNAYEKIYRSHGTKLVICGKGELERELRQQIDKKGLASSVSLLGHVEQSELISLYQRTSVFVFPSLYEGLPTVVLEAMSCGAPVVVSKIPAHIGLIEDGVNGMFSEVNNPDDIAKKVCSILADKTLSMKLSKGAVETIRSNYTWDNIGNKFTDLYERVLPKGTE